MVLLRSGEAHQWSLKPGRPKAGGKRQVREGRTGPRSTGKKSRRLPIQEVPAGASKRLRILERLEAQANFNASNARLAARVTGNPRLYDSGQGCRLQQIHSYDDWALAVAR